MIQQEDYLTIQIYLNQLIKIKSVINKSAVNLTIKTILVLDGTNGSNMINQVEIIWQNFGCYWINYY